MAKTPDRRPGPLEEDEEIRLATNGAGPTLAGAFNFDGTAFVMRDSTGNFNPRTGGSGITAAQHEVIDSLVHELAETSYIELTRSAGQVTDVITWETAAKLKKVREANITRASGQVSVVVEKQYDGAGSLAQTLTYTITRSGGQVASIDAVEV